MLRAVLCCAAPPPGSTAPRTLRSCATTSARPSPWPRPLPPTHRSSPASRWALTPCCCCPFFLLVIRAVLCCPGSKDKERWLLRVLKSSAFTPHPPARLAAADAARPHQEQAVPGGGAPPDGARGRGHSAGPPPGRGVPRVSGLMRLHAHVLPLFGFRGRGRACPAPCLDLPDWLPRPRASNSARLPVCPRPPARPAGT